MSNILEKLQFETLEFLMFVVDEIAEEMESNGNDIIRLTLGKSPEDLHEKIVQEYNNAISDIRKRNLVYPQGLPALRKKIAEWYSSMGNPTKEKNIIINTGTSPLFKDMFRFILEMGDEVLLPFPYYSVYNVSALLTHATIKHYHIDPTTLLINLKDFEGKFNPEKTKIVVLNSPGNPLGNIISQEVYEHILKIVDGRAYIISDEIYRNIGFYGKVPSILDVKNDTDKVIVSNSFSKGFRMYTTRVGFFILPDNLIEPFRVLLQHTLLTANSAAQYACLEALNHLDEVDRLNALYRSRSEYAMQRLNPISTVTAIKPQGGFYFVLLAKKFMKRNKLSTSLELAKDILEKTMVAVVPGSDFGIDYSLRISFTHNRFNEAIDRLCKYFDK